MMSSDPAMFACFGLPDVRCDQHATLAMARMHVEHICDNRKHKACNKQAASEDNIHEDMGGGGGGGLNKNGLGGGPRRKKR